MSIREEVKEREGTISCHLTFVLHYLSIIFLTEIADYFDHSCSPVHSSK